jgi:hypothetical protein
MFSWLLIVFILAYSISILCILCRALTTPDTSAEPRDVAEERRVDIVRVERGVLVLQPDGKVGVGMAV